MLLALAIGRVGLNAARGGFIGGDYVPTPSKLAMQEAIHSWLPAIPLGAATKAVLEAREKVDQQLLNINAVCAKVQGLGPCITARGLALASKNAQAFRTLPCSGRVPYVSILKDITKGDHKGISDLFSNLDGLGPN